MAGSEKLETIQNLYCKPCHAANEIIFYKKWCNDCNFFLCVKCVQRHSVGVTSEHSLIEPDTTCEEKIAEILKINIKCVEHPQENISMYCLDDHAAHCKNCFAASHANCSKVFEIENLEHTNNKYDINELPLKDILQNVVALQSTIKSMDTQKQATYNQNISELLSLKEKLIQHINELFIEPKNKLESQFQNDKEKNDEVLSKTEGMVKWLQSLIEHQNVLNFIDAQTCKSLNLKLTQKLFLLIQIASKYENNCSEKSFGIQYAEQVNSIFNLKQAVDFQESTEKSPNFKHELDMLRQQNKVIFSLLFPESPSKIMMESQGIDFNAVFKKALFKSDFSLDNICFYDGCFLKNGQFLAIDYINARLYFFNGDFKKLESTKLQRNTPCGIFVTDDSNQTWITFNKSVRQYSLEDNNFSREYKISDPSGIVVTADGDLIIGLKQKVIMMGVTGDHKNEVLIDTPAKVTFRDVCLSPKGDIFYHSDGNDIIGRKVLDFEEVSCWSHKKLVEPCGITCDLDGNVYVAGFASQNVIYFSADGQTKHVLIDKCQNIKKVRIVRFDSKSNNLVVSSSNEDALLEVYQLSTI